MKLLITGSNGFVAGSIIAQTGTNWEVHGIAKTAMPGNPLSFTLHLGDLQDKERVSEIFTTVAPDAVIHAAAIANIDYCEQNQELAWAINVETTRTLATLCKAAGTRLVFCSTDTVFDGTRGFFTETDIPHAVNYYATTKLESEKLVMDAASDNIVARLALVMGFPVLGKGNSFLSDIQSKLEKKETLLFAENEIRTPIDVHTLGAALIELAGKTVPGGIIHLSGNTRINRFEMAKQIATALGYAPDAILPTNSNAIQGRAPRPNDASLDNSKAKQILQTRMCTLAEGLQLCINNKKSAQP